MEESYWSRNFILILIGNALLFMVYNMQVPVLPLYGKQLGLTPAQIGVFVGAIMFAALVTRLFVPWFSAHFSKRLLLVVGILLYLLAAVGYPLLSSFGLLVLLRLFNGLGHGITTTYFATSAADELPHQKIGEGMGYFGIGTMVTASLAPLLALAVVHHYGFTAFFLTCIGVLFAAMLAIMGTTKPTAPAARAKATAPVFDRQFLPQCGLVFILGVLMSGVMTFTPIYAEIQHLTTISGFFFIAAVAGVVIRPIVGRMFDHRGPRLILLLSTVLLTLGMVLIALIDRNWLLLLAGVFYGVADGAIYPTLQAWLFKVTSIHNRDTATGMFLNAYDLGMGLGAVVLGWVVEAVAYRGMFLILAVVACGYVALALGLSRGTKRI
ncbi:MFS transporter [Levilactobacillus hammesii]|uniref:Major facilitator superfamily protein n=1 Tax=Levilactobacillus hammesii DSM 16381 TaxID=1423753 RepID=A0A0R1UJT6_9LACO|nr:MFS transporter [Levilactobacillus hammesii]KRL93601.1 major facilitator superfamily protein [Levilactobacillus hammesii DSM 16381]